MKKELTVVYETDGRLCVMDDTGDIVGESDDAEFMVFFTRTSRRRGTLTIVNTDTNVSYSVPADDIIKALQEGAEHGTHFDVFGPFRRLVV